MKPFHGMPVGPDVQLFKPSSGPMPGYVHVNSSFIISREDAVPRSVADRAQKLHPRRVRHAAPGPHRAFAHLLANPSLIATGFAALAVYGLPFLTDHADTVLTSKSVPRKQLATAFDPGLIRSDPSDVWHVNYRAATLQAVPPATALAQALALVRQGEVTWDVTPVPALAPDLVRAIQLIDTARHFLELDPVELLAASRQRVELTWLVSALIHSSAFAESPKETEMRLLAQEVARRFKVTLVEQFVLLDASGTPITRFDLAFPDLKIGLMYDGAQHWEHERRHKDTSINLQATVLNWQVLRFSARTLYSLISVLEAILTARGLSGTSAG